MAELTPEIVERMIDEAGRERVFARARALGWAAEPPPLWVWAGIASDIKAGVALTVPPQRTDEALFGYRLF